MKINEKNLYQVFYTVEMRWVDCAKKRKNPGYAEPKLLKVNFDLDGKLLIQGFGMGWMRRSLSISWELWTSGEMRF